MHTRRRRTPRPAFAPMIEERASAGLAKACRSYLERDKRRRATPSDVGTLWTMERRRHSARCALMAWPASWELRVVVAHEILLTEHCAAVDEAFTLAEHWKRSMRERGWRQVVPQSARLAPLVDDRP